MFERKNGCVLICSRGHFFRSCALSGHAQRTKRIEGCSESNQIPEGGIMVPYFCASVRHTFPRRLTLYRALYQPCLCWQKKRRDNDIWSATTMNLKYTGQGSSGLLYEGWYEPQVHGWNGTRSLKTERHGPGTHSQVVDGYFTNYQLTSEMLH